MSEERPLDLIDLCRARVKRDWGEKNYAIEEINFSATAVGELYVGTYIYTVTHVRKDSISGHDVDTRAKTTRVLLMTSDGEIKVDSIIDQEIDR